VRYFPVPTDKLLSDLVVAMDQSDVEYAAIMKELKTEIFGNLCRQERLGEHLSMLEMKKEQLQSELDRSRSGEEESRARSELEEELCRNDGHQEKLREKLQGLEKSLRMVKATASAEELMQEKATEVNVGHAVLG